jgi:hypothetical protein
MPRRRVRFASSTLEEGAPLMLLDGTVVEVVGFRETFIDDL